MLDDDRRRQNYIKPRLRVEHAKLSRASEETGYRSRCPECGEGGVLLVQRDQQTFKLLRADVCIRCWRRFWYTDEQINGERFFMEDDPKLELPRVDLFMTDADLTSAAEKVVKSAPWERLPVLKELLRDEPTEGRLWHELIALTLCSLERNALVMSKRVMAEVEKKDLIASMIIVEASGAIPELEAKRLAARILELFR